MLSSPTLSSIRPLCLEPRAKRRGGRWVQVKRWGCDGKGGGALGPQVRAGLGWGLHPSPSSAVCSVVASLSSVGWAPALAQQRGLLLKAAVRGWGDKGCGMGEGAAKWRAGPWFACSLSSPRALWWTHLTCTERGRSQPLRRRGGIMNQTATACFCHAVRVGMDVPAQGRGACGVSKDTAGLNPDRTERVSAAGAGTRTLGAALGIPSSV